MGHASIVSLSLVESESVSEKCFCCATAAEPCPSLAGYEFLLHAVQATAHRTVVDGAADAHHCAANQAIILSKAGAHTGPGQTRHLLLHLKAFVAVQPACGDHFHLCDALAPVNLRAIFA